MLQNISLPFIILFLISFQSFHVEFSDTQSLGSFLPPNPHLSLPSGPPLSPLYPPQPEITPTLIPNPAHLFPLKLFFFCHELLSSFQVFTHIFSYLNLQI